ncbi:unhealthy ribosome biogenesis protein 2 homolog [Salmo trutta]|nr:unhealthy ribosome biogenesis protein 2 homolog [Salmo trutta]
MAAMYSGIHLKLKNPKTPWVDKLKLARFAWISSQCLLPNKEQVLFDWISHALTGFYSKKVELPQVVVEGLWIYLDDILHSKKLHSVLSQGKTISLRLAVAQVIIERIQEFASGTSSASVSTVLSCCQGILSSSVLSVTFTTKYELLVELLAKLCALGCSKLSQQQATDPLTPQVFEVLLLTLSSYLAVQKQQANANRVFAQVTTHLLQHLLLLRHLLTSRAWMAEDDPRVRQHLSRDIRGKVDTILQSALFLPDHLQAYKEELLSKEEPGMKKGAAGKGLLSPVNSILSKLCAQGYCDTDLHFAVRSSSLPLLFKFSLDAYCKGGDNKVLCFHMLTQLIAALDFTNEVTLKDLFDGENWSLALLALENLLNLCLTADIYNVAADRIKYKEVQLIFYRKVVRLLFDNAQPSISAWYRCLKALLSLNHLIIEPDLDELLSAGWIDSDCTEPRVRKAREALISSVLQIYAKLRQLPKFFEELLAVICRPAMDELRQPVLPEAVHRTLSTCLLDNPTSQSLEICCLILENVTSYVLPDLEGNGDLSLKLFSLSVLLYSVLFSLKTLDNSTPVPVVRQTQALMEKMLQVVKSVLQLAQGQAPEVPGCQKVQDAGLLLKYTWVEVDTLFQIHCTKYTSPVDPASVNILDDIGILLSGVMATGEDQASPIGQDCSPMTHLLQKLLTLQQMKKVILSNELLAQTRASDVLRLAAQYIVGRGDPQLCQHSDQLWDRQVSSVDASTYPVAHWYLVTTNLPMISPFLTEEEVCHIADVLLSSLLQKTPDDTTERLSVSLISKDLLESLVLVELPTIYSAVVRCVTQRILGILNGNPDMASVCPALMKLSELSCSTAGDKGSAVTQSDGDVSESHSALKRLEAIAQHILSSSTTGASITLSQRQADNLLSLLQVTNALNPDGMSSEDFSGIFLLLILMVTDTQLHNDVKPAVTIHLLNQLFSLMGLLLAGNNSHHVLKIVHGSSLLEAALTALFSHSNKGLFQTVDSSAWLTFLKTVQDFIQSLILLIIHRKSSVRLNLEKFTTYLVNSEVAVMALSSLPGNIETGGLFAIQLLLASMNTLCQAMTSSLRTTKQLDETLSQLLGKTTAVMGPAIQASLRAQTGSLLHQAFSVDVVTGMVRSELACAYPQDEPSEGITQESLSHMGMYRSFSQQILRELCPSQRPMDFLVSSLHFLSAYYAAAEITKALGQEELFVAILQNVHKLLAAPWLSVSEVRYLEEPVKELLDQLLVRSTPEQFHLLLLLLRDGLDTSKFRSGCHREVLSTVTIMKLLASSLLPETCLKAFWLIAPQIISSLVFLVKEAGKEPTLTAALTVPVLDTLTAMLRQGEGMLSNPHHVTMVLGALQFVPLEHLTMEIYHTTFEAIHEALFAVIQCHPQVMLKAAPSFLNCFYRLVVSIMHEGRQKGEAERAPEIDAEVLLKCARLVERMYSHIATTAEGFTILSSFMVAQYVSELQKVTLQPDIKSHLTEGVYRILDLCVEQDVKFLNTTLQMGVREVFNELYGSYTHYHKTQRQGEEKYTA